MYLVTVRTSDGTEKTVSMVGVDRSEITSTEVNKRISHDSREIVDITAKGESKIEELESRIESLESQI